MDDAFESGTAPDQEPVPVSPEDTPSSNQNSPINTMEVHHHPDLHHAPKKWKEYLLECLMIFVAVTMGFIAENIREHISQRAKADEYAESLYKEVYSDSVNMVTKLALRARKEEEMQYFRNFIVDSNLEHVSDRFFCSFAWSFILTTSIVFEPNDGVLSELKSSGAQRYLKDLGLQKKISDIGVCIAKLRSRNAQEYTFVEDFTRPFTIQFYDFTWHDAFSQHGKLSILESVEQVNFHAPKLPVIKNLAEFKRDHAEALAAYYLLLIRATRQLYYEDYKKKNHLLLEALRSQYQFN